MNWKTEKNKGKISYLDEMVQQKKFMEKIGPGSYNISSST